MDITDIRIKKVESKNSGSKLLAYVAVTFDNFLGWSIVRIKLFGTSTSGKSTGFGPVIRGFESFRPSILH